MGFTYGGEYGRGRVLDATTWTVVGVSLLFVGLRLISRIVLSHTYGLDDSLIIWALIVLLVFAIVQTYAISLGLGLHITDIPLTRVITAGHWSVATTSLSVQIFCWPKLAIIALLQRLFPMQRWLRVLFWVMGILLCLLCLLVSIFWYAQCTPRAHQWNPTGVPGTCWPAPVMENISYFVAAYSSLLDLVFGFYPFFVIRKLQMPLRRKIVVCAALGGGLVAACCSIYKISTLSVINVEARTDPTYTAVSVLFWTIVETGLLIVGATIPTLGHVTKYIYKKTTPLVESLTSAYRKVSHSISTSNDAKSTHDSKKLSWIESSNKATSDTDEINLIEVQCRAFGRPLSDSPLGTDQIRREVTTSMWERDRHDNTLSAV